MKKRNLLLEKKIWWPLWFLFKIFSEKIQKRKFINRNVTLTALFFKKKKKPHRYLFKKYLILFSNWQLFIFCLKNFFSHRISLEGEGKAYRENKKDKRLIISSLVTVILIPKKRIIRQSYILFLSLLTQTRSRIFS